MPDIRDESENPNERISLADVDPEDALRALKVNPRPSRSRAAVARKF